MRLSELTMNERGVCKCVRDEEVERRGEGKGCDCRFGIVILIFSSAWGLTIYFLVCRLLRFFFCFGFRKEKRPSASAVAVSVCILFLYYPLI